MARSKSTPNAIIATPPSPWGNELRELEYIAPDILASGVDTLVSIGGVQTNHTRMVAAVAARLGLKCRLVQESRVPHEDAVYGRVGNILLTHLLGADSRVVDDGFDIGTRSSWEAAMAEAMITDAVYEGKSMQATPIATDSAGTNSSPSANDTS